MISMKSLYLLLLIISLKRAETLMDLQITIFNDKVQDYNDKIDSIAKPTVTYINDELLNRARAKDFIKYVSILEKRNKIFQDYKENEIINACHNIGLFNENDNYEFLKGIAKSGLSPTGAKKVFNNLNDNSFVLVETEAQLTKQNEISEMQLVIEITSLIEAVYNKLMGITPPKKEEFKIRRICTEDIFKFISSKYANSKTKL